MSYRARLARFLRRGGARKGRETFVTPRVDRPSRYDFYDFSNVSPPFILLSLSLSLSIDRIISARFERERERGRDPYVSWFSRWKPDGEPRRAAAIPDSSRSKSHIDGDAEIHGRQT